VAFLLLKNWRPTSCNNSIFIKIIKMPNIHIGKAKKVEHFESSSNQGECLIRHRESTRVVLGWNSEGSRISFAFFCKIELFTEKGKGQQVDI
jgi:hypothetical protein